MIHPVVAQHIPAIRALYEEFGVQKLEIFGSAVTDRFDPAHSDVDFIVTYPAGYEFGPWGQRVFKLQDALSLLIGRNVDLIMSDAPGNPQIHRTPEPNPNGVLPCDRDFQRPVKYGVPCLVELKTELVQHEERPWG
jgi:predicted nucleotidyltransferase